MFAAFRVACANFVGFRNVIDLAYATTLLRFARERRTPGNLRDNIEFLYTVRDVLAGRSDDLEMVDTGLAGLIVRQKPALALSVRQPQAEAIMRGVKAIEYRSRPTNIRGRVYSYAARARTGTFEYISAPMPSLSIRSREKLKHRQPNLWTNRPISARASSLTNSTRISSAMVLNVSSKSEIDGNIIAHRSLSPLLPGIGTRPYQTRRFS